VQIRDMKIQETHDDLVLGTFGRSFWILDDIEPLRMMSRQGMKSFMDKPFAVMTPNTAYMTEYRSYNGIRFIAQGEFVGDNRTSAALFTIWNKPKEEKEDKDSDMSDDKKKSKKDKKKDTKKAKEESKKESSKESSDDESDDNNDMEEGAEGDDKDDESNDDSDKKEKGPKKGEVRVTCININGDTLRTFSRKLKPGFNRVAWDPDTKGITYPSRNEPKEKREPGGMPILPGEYKMVFEYGEYKDSTNLTVALDPRIEPSIVDTKAKYDAMSDYNKSVEAATQAYDNLKKAKKSLSLYKKIIEVQEDSISKNYNEKQTAISDKIDSIMNLYMLPEPVKPQYQDDSNTLMTKIWGGRRFLGTSYGAPSPNGEYAVDTAKREIEEMITTVNAFFSEDWKPYVEDIKSLPMKIFEEYEPVEIK
jgi:hypothetical protein